MDRKPCAPSPSEKKRQTHALMRFSQPRPSRRSACAARAGSVRVEEYESPRDTAGGADKLTRAATGGGGATGRCGGETNG
eukprot:4443629-Pleurochrysis_carterae.AAC.2